MNIRGNDGFSLIELMTVVLIIGILSSVAVIAYSNMGASAQRNACLSNQRVLAGAIRQYEADHDGTLPADDSFLGQFVKSPDKARRCPTDLDDLLHFDSSKGEYVIWCELHVDE